MPNPTPEPASDRSPGRRSAGRRALGLSLLPLGLLAGFVGGRKLAPRRAMRLPRALQGDLETFDMPFGRVAYYRAGLEEGTPLLFVHSVNAAANSYEFKPLFDYYARHRPVFALDLPGFGFSDRPDMLYTPQLMSEAVIAMADVIRARHGLFPVDICALSLSCEFVARAAADHPTYFRTLAFISPTGFDKRRQSEAEGTFGQPAVRDLVTFPVWRRALFDALVSRPSLRFFLQKTWGSRAIDEGLLEYDYLSAHQPGAEFAPFSFVSGFLFSRDALRLYKSLTRPVLMLHGVRGDFVDYSKSGEVADRPNWTIHVLPTGALPQFELPEAVTAAYDGFLGEAV